MKAPHCLCTGLLVFCMIVVGCVSLPHPRLFEGFPIVAQGKSNATIVLSDNALPVERFAAQELQRYVRKISGVNLPIGGMRGPGRHIFVGTVKNISSMVLLWDLLTDVQEETVVIWPRGEDLILAGGSPRATLWAVYGMLGNSLAKKSKFLRKTFSGFASQTS